MGMSDWYNWAFMSKTNNEKSLDNTEAELAKRKCAVIRIERCYLKYLKKKKLKEKRKKKRQLYRRLKRTNPRFLKNLPKIREHLHHIKMSKYNF